MGQITTDPAGGKKADGDKVRFELLIPEFIEAFARVMTHGAKKYDAWNYLKLDRERVIGALHRHVNAYQRGEINDPETGESHLIHATCCMMMLWGIDNKFWQKERLLEAMRETEKQAFFEKNNIIVREKYDEIPDIPGAFPGVKAVPCNTSTKQPNVSSNTLDATKGEIISETEAFKRATSANINTENVKVKGDLVALRYMVHDFGSNLSDFETHCSLNCQDYDDDALLVNRAEFVENGEWLVFHKNTIRLAMFKIITHDEFTSKLKHLFE